MLAKKLDSVKFRNLSWVIILIFETIEEANNFSEAEGLNVKIDKNGQYEVVKTFGD